MAHLGMRGAVMSSASTAPSPGALQAYVSGAPSQSYAENLSTLTGITLVFSALFSTWTASGMIMEHSVNASTYNTFNLADTSSSVISLYTAGISSGRIIGTFPRPSVGTLHKIAISIDLTPPGTALVAVDGAAVTFTATSRTMVTGSTFPSANLFMASRNNSSNLWTGSESSPPAIVSSASTSAQLMSWTT